MRGKLGWMGGLVAAGLIACLAGGAMNAQEKGAKSSAKTVKVGDRAPSFEGTDESGDSSSIAGSKYLAKLPKLRPAFPPSKSARTISTFACDIAYPLDSASRSAAARP